MKMKCIFNFFKYIFEKLMGLALTWNRLDFGAQIIYQHVTAPSSNETKVNIQVVTFLLCKWAVNT